MPENINLTTELEAALAEVGVLEIPRSELHELAIRVYRDLEYRVGVDLSSALTDAELEEFESIMDDGDDEAAAHWLGVHVPNYREVTERHTEALIRSVVEAASVYFGGGAR